MLTEHTTSNVPAHCLSEKILPAVKYVVTNAIPIGFVVFGLAIRTVEIPDIFWGTFRNIRVFIHLFTYCEKVGIPHETVLFIENVQFRQL